MEKTERRFCLDPQLRAIREDGKPPMLRGYAAVFNKPSERLWGWDGDFVEFIAPGAFARTLADNDPVVANVNHRGGIDTRGRNTAGTLKLSEDETGLLTEIFPPNTQTGRDILELVGRGDLSKMSFAFEVRDHKVEKPKERGDPAIVTLLDVRLFDVSVVDRPAYPDTEVAVRRLEAAFGIRPRANPDTLRRLLEMELVA